MRKCVQKLPGYNGRWAPFSLLNRMRVQVCRASLCKLRTHAFTTRVLFTLNDHFECRFNIGNDNRLVSACSNGKAESIQNLVFFFQNQFPIGKAKKEKENKKTLKKQGRLLPRFEPMTYGPSVADLMIWLRRTATYMYMQHSSYSWARCVLV